MIEVTGDIWGYLGRATVAITTSGSLSRSGKAVLLRGVAKEAALRFPELSEELGLRLRESGNRVHLLGHGLVSFPVEESAWQWPDPRLIERSARELRELADHEAWTSIVVPRPGCGGGGLEWREVRPLVEEHFDDRFIVIRAAEI